MALDQMKNYIGAPGKLERQKYQMSYKLVFMLAYFSLCKMESSVSLDDIYKFSMEYYQDNIKTRGLSEFSRELKSEVTLSSVKRVFSDAPLNALLSSGLFKRSIDKHKISLTSEVYDNLKDDDRLTIIDLLLSKLDMYYNLQIKAVDSMEQFVNLMKRVAAEYKQATMTAFKSNEIAQMLRSEIPKCLARVVGDTNLICSGSPGKGNWATIPWFGIADKRVSTAITNGFYLVYLVNPESKTVYLSLAFGVDAIFSKHKKNGHNYLKKLVIDKQNIINKRPNIKMDLGESKYGKLYPEGSIYFYKYELEELNDKQKLYDDLMIMIEDYMTLIEHDDIEMVDLEPVLAETDEVEMNVSLRSIQEAIALSSYTYSINTVKSVLLSIKSKPFALLAGLSGSGKTRFVRELSKICGATIENERFLLVPVRPDWTDASDVLGYFDLKGEFKATKLTQFIYKANQNPSRPYFVCFDEMNLARVEHYFSDFLSVIETRELRKNGRIESDCLFLNQNIDEANPFRKISITDNIYIFGTVNMDETTYPFSSKVLDRANTIEFNDINLKAVFEKEDSYDVMFQDIHNNVLKGEFSTLNEAIKSLGDAEAKQVVQSLEDLNSILSTVGIGFGYRVRDEVLSYIAYALKYELLEYNEAMDFCIVQKVLPKVKGSDSSLRNVLRDLFQYCSSIESLKWKDEKLNDYEVMNECINKGDCSYPHSAKKLVKLMKSFEVDGYASYW